MSLTKEQIQSLKNTKLSKNFTMFEMVSSSSYPSLMTFPDKNTQEAMRTFALEVLQPIRDHVGPVRINSGWRNKHLNTAVGGVYNSVHRIFDSYGEFIGVAADIVPVDNSIRIEELARWIYDNIPVKTVIVYRKRNVTRNPFLHIDTRVMRPDKVLLEKIGNDKYIIFED